MENRKVLITGGGSGGHLSVASGLIEGIRKRYPENFDNILYVGGDLGMVGEKFGTSIEQRRFKNADFKCRYIRAGKLQRNISLSSIKLTFRTLLGVFDALKIIREEKPDLIFSSGGFVTVPVCFAGWLKRIPIYLHEQTAAVGLSNQIVAKFAKKIFITFESSKDHFKKQNTIHTGNIVRESVFKKRAEGEVAEKIIYMKESNLPIIYISGGGLGSHTMNTLILNNIEELTRKYNVILQMGENKTLNDYDIAIEKRKNLTNSKRFLPIRYIYEKEIGFLYNSIDLYIGRAGANTVYEIGLLRIPSIFIPIPWVTHNEQEKNAQNLVNIGLSKILKEEKLDSINIIEYIDKFLKEERAIDIKALENLFPKDGLKKILDEIFK